MTFFASRTYAADFTLQWDVPLEWDIAGYNIYYDSDGSGPEYEGTGADQGDSPIVTQTTNPAGPFYIDPNAASPQFSITGLPDGQVYYFSVTTYDSRGMESIYALEVDTLAPQITSPPTVVAVSDTTATIQWTTDKPGTSVVEFGTTDQYLDPDSPKTLSAYVTSHSVTLTGLDPETEYHFQASSVNAQGIGPEHTDNDNNPSEDDTFTTEPASAPDTSPPVITTPPSVVSIADTTAVIVWETNEPSDSRVEYGLTTGYGSTVTSDTDVITHSVSLSGLTQLTTYQFRVGSQDIAGNARTYSGNYSFSTVEAADTVPPVIVSAPTVTSITDNSAVIEWETDEPATSIVEYGLTTTYARSKVLTDYVTDHAVTLTLLDSGVLYHFRVGSTDEDDNGPRYSGDSTFTTELPPDTAAPVIVSSPTVTGITDTTATIVWDTDEPSNSQVRYAQSAETWDNMSGRVNKADMADHHSVTLTGLANATTYYFRVGSTDALGNGPNPAFTADNNPTNSALSFATHPDTTAPVITSAPTISAKTDTTATIAWTTDEPSNSQVRFDTATGSWFTYTQAKNSAVMDTQHSVTLTGLDEAQTYYFRVGSTDLEGNDPDPVFTSDNNPTNVEFSFTTLPDQTDPVISVPPTVTGVTNTTAVISWSTNEPANSLVQYGDNSANWGGYDLSQNDAAMVMTHNVTLTDLEPETPYYFRVGSTDGEGNGPVTSAQGSFTTEPDPDITAPVITSPPTVVDITYTTATIAWETDEPANGLVRYDIAQRIWSSYAYSKSTSTMSTGHSVTLTGLANGQRYYFRVASTDADGNGPDTDSGDNNPFSETSFITEQAPDEQAPQIVSEVTVTAVDNASAIITWETDESSNSIVQYGTVSSAWNGYFFTISDPGMTTAHSVVLGGLQPNTTYWFRAGSVDAVGNGPDWHPAASNPSAEKSFTTSDGPDEIAPNIVTGPIVAHKTNRIALIEWTTDEPSNSVVKFDIVPGTWNSYHLVESDADLTTAHSVTIVVQPGTTYYLRVGSTDIHGNGPDPDKTEDNNPTNAELVFTSEIGPDQTAPQVFGVQVTSLSDTTVRVNWTTDEPGNSLVRYDTGSRQWEGYALETNIGDLTTEHSVTLTGLAPSSLYYLRVSSIDATGNTYDSSTTDMNPSIEYNVSTQEADPPSVVIYPDPDYPRLDPVNNTLDITFDELNMQNVENESNYLFQPHIAFKDPGNSIVAIGISGDRSRFRFYLKPDPGTDLTHAIFRLELAADITDADGLQVQPNIVMVNDVDEDGLPDDWELAVVDADPDDDILDIFDIEREGDPDGDGSTNYEEFLNNTDPTDAASVPKPPEYLETIPHDGAGIDDDFRVARNASFAVLISDNSGGGIDVSQADNIVLTVNDGSREPYEVHATDTDVRIVDLAGSSDPESLTKFWLVYDRSLSGYGVWDYSSTVRISVVSLNKNQQYGVAEYTFKVESVLDHEFSINPKFLPDFSSTDAADPDVTAPYDSGWKVDSGDLSGFKIVYDSTEPVPPTFAPSSELLPFDVADTGKVGAAANLQPPTVFTTPVKLIIPTPGYKDARKVNIYVFDGENWVLGCNADGSLGKEGWYVPGSRVNGASRVEIKVYHFSGVQAATGTAAAVDGASKTSAKADASCFIDCIKE